MKNQCKILLKLITLSTLAFGSVTAMNHETASSLDELGQLLFGLIFYPSNTKRVQELIERGASVHVEDQFGCSLTPF